MNLFNNAIILSLEVFKANFQKKETVFVPGRSFHSLTFRNSGKITITENGKTKVSAAPSVTYVPKGTSYYTEVTENGHITAVHFQMTEEAEKYTGIKVFSLRNPLLLQNLFSALSEKHKIENPKDYTCLSLFYEILSELDSNSENSNISKRLKEAKAYIDKNFSDPNLSVNKISDLLGVSEVYLRKEFRAAFGISPLAYIKNVRHNNAKAMLKTGYYSVSTVAENCGFLSLNYFSYDFHRMSGMSPTEYVKNHIK